jgi:hypothetical protein
MVKARPRSRRVRGGGVTLGAALLALVAPGGRPSFAADRRDPRDLEAERACLAGRHQRGLELLAELFTETGDPTHLYNQGRCLQQNGLADEAIARFREYLRKGPSLSAEDRALADARIAECEELRARQRPATTMITTPTTTSTAPARAASGSSPRGELRAAAGARQGRVQAAGIAVGAAGVAALAMGAVLSLRVEGIERTLERDGYDRDRTERGRLYEKLQWVGYGAGALLVGGGAALYLRGRRGQEGATAALRPIVGRAGAGAIVEGRF